MSEKTKDDIDKLHAEMAQLRADLGQIAETLRGIVKDGKDEAVGKARETAQKLRDEVAGKTERLAHEIEQRPLTSALAAFGLGLILGMMFHGRRD
ncbi:MAG: hypothetical protein KIT16_10640 [Rhodospirillaceae bacterium]|nr:hypothetical protein [Rhodospirillaceae bacterium]